VRKDIEEEDGRRTITREKKYRETEEQGNEKAM